MIAGHLGNRVDWWFTDRDGGVSAAPYDTLNLGAHVGDDPAAVAANRVRLAAVTGVPGRRLVTMRPAHGAAVAVVPGPESGWAAGPGGVDGVDALVTATPGVGLLALGADCMMILLADPRAGVVGAVHCGWRGLVVDVAGAAVQAMVGRGADTRRITGVLGPAICGGCYAVPEDRVAAVASRRPEAATRSRAGEPALDLRAGVRAALADHGIEVTSVGGCTQEDPRWFSFRRDGRTGRHAGVIVLRDRGVPEGGP